MTKPEFVSQKRSVNIYRPIVYKQSDMRRIILFLFAAAIIGFVSVNADTFTYKDTQGLYYYCDDATREAVLIACPDADAGYECRQDAIVIPATLTINSSIGDEGAFPRHCASRLRIDS